VLTRRELITRGALASAVLAGARGAAAQELAPSPPVQPFTRRLPIPRPHLPLNRPGATPLELAKADDIYHQAEAESRYKGDPVLPSGPCDYYEVVATEGVQEIIPGTLTRVLGYNGLYPGATFFSERNRPACVRFINRIPEAEIMAPHYHGAHTPPDSDGVPMLSYGPHDIISSGHP
jgi:FtsP/CotA-like multicopper oxidase with cupredoxin domain